MKLRSLLVFGPLLASGVPAFAGTPIQSIWADATCKSGAITDVSDVMINGGFAYLKGDKNQFQPYLQNNQLWIKTDKQSFEIGAIDESSLQECQKEGSNDELNLKLNLSGPITVQEKFYGCELGIPGDDGDPGMPAWGPESQYTYTITSSTGTGSFGRIADSTGAKNYPLLDRAACERDFGNVGNADIRENAQVTKPGSASPIGAADVHQGGAAPAGGKSGS